PILGTISAEGVYTAPIRIPVPPTVTISATHRDDAKLTASAVVTIVPAFGLLLASRPVSVAAAAPRVTMDRSVGAAVSVLAAAPHAATPVVSVPGAVAMEPVVLGVTRPTTAAGGTIAITTAGHGLRGATSVVFLRNNTADPAFTVDDVVVNADGTAATTHVTVAAGTTPGARVLQ